MERQRAIEPAVATESEAVARARPSGKELKEVLTVEEIRIVVRYPYFFFLGLRWEPTPNFKLTWMLPVGYNREGAPSGTKEVGGHPGLSNNARPYPLLLLPHMPPGRTGEVASHVPMPCFDGIKKLNAPIRTCAPTSTTAPRTMPTDNATAGEAQTMTASGGITQNHHRHHHDDDDDGDHHHHHHHHVGTTCSPHKDHWHCPAGVPSPTTPPPTASSSSGGKGSSKNNSGSASNAKASSSSTTSSPTSTGAAAHLLLPGSAAYAIFGAVAFLSIPHHGPLARPRGKSSAKKKKPTQSLVPATATAELVSRLFNLIQIEQEQEA
ncbi:hypothetical protein L249_6413 [Ophiocordyceps polyrhachis-furcata BCC 54312]|uniref:Uncharacterized protein n=1 Tax=Ophiocordyceps polyrhachis-furcata BCC 54312 TaxID=1330021 RepID=A0A367LJT4_9HYPO|nr:hypothetical protein L249_6413 [Ophiocordyceps polyrhachis-furcata BCC 54312]